MNQEDIKREIQDKNQEGNQEEKKEERKQQERTVCNPLANPYESTICKKSGWSQKIKTEGEFSKTMNPSFTILLTIVYFLSRSAYLERKSLEKVTRQTRQRPRAD